MRLSNLLLELLVGAALLMNAKHEHVYPKIDTTTVPEWGQVSPIDSGGKLYLSDSPETVTQNGVLYQDDILGSGRLFFHHVNGTDTIKKFAVLFENPGNEKAYIIVAKHGLGGPGLDYLSAGKAAQAAYMGKEDAYLIEVPPHGTASLLGNDISVKPGMLVSGIYDFKADKMLTMKVIMMPENVDAATFAKQAAVLPNDKEHLRGSFETSNRTVTISGYNPERDGIVAVTLADNKVDKYLQGLDKTLAANNTTQDYGNYGVVYSINIQSQGSKPVSYYLNPWGGSYAGILGVKYQSQELKPMATPGGKVSFGENTLQDLAYLGTYQSGQPLSFIFSPPGSSNLPVRLIAIPGK